MVVHRFLSKSEFQLWKIKKLMLSRFFMKEENPKPIISEKNQHTLKSLKMLVRANSREYFRKFFCRGNRELYFVKVF